jgi:hypothetical protein
VRMMHMYMPYAYKYTRYTCNSKMCLHTYLCSMETVESSRFVPDFCFAFVKSRARRAALSQWEVTMIPDPSRHWELGRKLGGTGRIG